MSLSLRADQDTVAEADGGRRNREVVGWDHRSGTGQSGKQIRPAFGDSSVELDNREPRNQRLDPGPAARSARRRVSEPYSYQKLRIDDRGNHGRIQAKDPKVIVEITAEPLDRDERARVDD